MREDLLDRMRVLAVVLSSAEGQKVTLEDVVNRVLERGLPDVEKEAYR